MKKSWLPLFLLGVGPVLTAGKEPVQSTAGKGPAPLAPGVVAPAPAPAARPAALPPVRPDAFSPASGAGVPAAPAGAQALTPLSAARTPSRRPNAALSSEIRPVGSPDAELEDLDLGGPPETKGVGPEAGPAWSGAGTKVLITVPEPGAGRSHRLAAGSAAFQEAFTITNATGDFLIFHLVRPAEAAADDAERTTCLLPDGQPRRSVALSPATRRNFLLRNGKTIAVCLQELAGPAQFELLDGKGEPVHVLAVHPGLDGRRPFRVRVDQVEAGSSALAFLRGLEGASGDSAAAGDARQAAGS